MKHIRTFTKCVFLIGVVICSCSKHDQITRNNSPIANAGKDTTVYEMSTELNGTGSNDPENNITSYSWRKIAGPPSFHIDDPRAAQTKIAELIEGVYQFELTVTDAVGLWSRDTVSVTVLNGEMVYNLTWTNDASNKMLFLESPALPSTYPMARLNMVYLYRGGFTAPGVTVNATWFPIQKDGTTQGTYNYKIVNNTVVAYQFYDVYNSNGFSLVGNQLKLVFR